MFYCASYSKELLSLVLVGASSEILRMDDEADFTSVSGKF